MPVDKNNKTSKISVVIPVYNEIENIDYCIHEVRKVLDRSSYLFELIFVDDGSDDGSTEKIKSYCQNDSNISLIELNQNYGQQAALLVGLKYCKGDWNSCVRYHFEERCEYHPDWMLPDGSFDERLK